MTAPPGLVAEQFRRNAPTAQRRPVLTTDDAFRAGWDDGALDSPLTTTQQRRVIALLAPHTRPAHRAA